MNTHILILIKDIEELIKQVKKVPKYADDYEEGVAYGKKDILEDILTQGKQISLNEKEIGEKAVTQSLKFASTAPEDYSLGYIDGYKQLIKDLL